MSLFCWRYFQSLFVKTNFRNLIQISLMFVARIQIILGQYWFRWELEQAANFYLNQWWSRTAGPNGVTRHQCFIVRGYLSLRHPVTSLWCELKNIFFLIPFALALASYESCGWCRNEWCCFRVLCFIFRIYPENKNWITHPIMYVRCNRFRTLWHWSEYTIIQERQF